jgi:DNA-binding LacI/PurR family transcriptional regulator
MTTDAPLKPTPRWKEVYDQLLVDLHARRYGSDFYSIAEVCRRFEVSQITAIRALNELASRKLIEKIAGKGNVVRRVEQTFPIWLITPDATNGSYGSMDSAIRRRVAGVSRAAEQLGLSLDFVSESRLLPLFPRQDGPVGFMVPHQISNRTIDFLREHRLPYVMLDTLESTSMPPYARVDRVRAGYLGTRHLLDLGHRRIGWITGLLSRRNFRDRLRGYRDALREAGVPFRWSLIRETETNESDRIRTALRSLLAMRRPPTALLTGDDYRAIDVLDECRKLGVHVPGELSVVSYPNHAESRLTTPPLTVVDANFEMVGEAAVRLLMEQVLAGADAAGQCAQIEPTLVVRGSTGPARPRTSAQLKPHLSTGSPSEVKP